MPQFFTQLVLAQGQDQSLQTSGFWHDQELVIFNSTPYDEEQTLNYLIFKLCRNPENLLCHLRRIYYCYLNGRSGHLYAALLDFLLVLKGRGQAISRRMIVGCRRQLDQHQILVLEHAVTEDLDRFGNFHSIFTTGRIAHRELFVYRKHAKTEYDVLKLANDFIEYSQLDQAMEVLETGLRDHPDRVDLQDALLELYLSTGSRERLLNFYNANTAAGMPFNHEWRQAADSSAGRS